MQKLVLACLLALAVSRGEDQDASGARGAIEKYLEGHRTGKVEPILQAFHPGAKIQGMGADGKFRDWSIEEYAKGFTGKPPEGLNNRVLRVDMVEVTGDAGIARATVEFARAMATDYFVLLRRDGVWRIANKVFAIRPKSETR